MLKDLLQHTRFEWPWMIFLGVLIPFLIWRLFYSQKKETTYRVNGLPPISPGSSLKVFFRQLPEIFAVFGVLFLIVALMRPVYDEKVEINTGEGIDIVLCLDVSGSMLAQDFTPNRLEASLAVARDFIKRRKGDRIGLVIFSGQSFTLCPITNDHNALLYQLNKVNYGMLSDGTSIGSGLASSVERLRTSKAKSRVVVLLTDGEDTGGRMDPATAKQLALTFEIKVYTIGMGTIGYAKMPYKTAIGTTVMEEEKVSIDETLLTDIAESTGGKYYRATNQQDLEDIYSTINGLEKSKVETLIFNKQYERFMPWAGLSIALFSIGWILRYTWLRKFPGG